jgi:hypothetical protein
MVDLKIGDDQTGTKELDSPMGDPRNVSTMTIVLKK